MKELNLKKAMNALIAAQYWHQMTDPDRLDLVGENEKKRRMIEREEALTAYQYACEDLRKALDEIQSNCTARTINAHRVCKTLQEVEKQLDITKKAMDGVTVAVDLNAQNFPGMYKGTPYSTIFEARYKSGSWRITDIYRAETRAQSKGCTVNLTEEAKAAILANFQSISI